jgi:5-methylcytosine-specific restriction endonuclease McrA
MSRVFVLDTNHRPLDPVHPGAARRMLSRGAAAVWRRYPFTLILKRAVPDAEPTPLRLKVDPGSKTTGMALVTETDGKAEAGHVVWAGEVTHRGQVVHERMRTRTVVRRARRQRHTRYRPPRFDNRRRADDWLAPSLESRVANVETWVRRLCRVAPVTALSQELVRFDTQALVNPEVSGVAYQQGTLAGYEVREYLLEKWQRRCIYCHTTGVPLQVEHIVPKARGGSDRVSNLTLACEPCNLAKGTRTAEEFGHPDVQAQARLPLRDAAAVNTTHWALYRRLQQTGLPVEVGTGGRTKWNRTRRALPKTHWLDAACVGASTPERLVGTDGVRPLLITARGRHARQMCRMDRFGFPRTGPKATSVVGGMRTGDLVRAVVPEPSVKAGTYVGRLAVRATGSCNIATARQGVVQGIHVRYCWALHRTDGYRYGHAGDADTSAGGGASTPGLQAGVSAPEIR